MEVKIKRLTESAVIPSYTKEGDVIYVKPDSLRGTIINSWEGNTKYEVKYFDSEGEEQTMYIEEFEIYGKIY